MNFFIFLFIKFLIVNFPIKIYLQFSILSLSGKAFSLLFALIINQETFKFLMGISILAASLLFILMYLNFRQIKKKNKQLENALEQLNDSNANIRSSITYAKRIQRAMV